MFMKKNNFLKKIISFFTILIFLFSCISFSYWYDNLNEKIEKDNLLLEDTPNDYYETQWVKTWIVKNALNWIASTLRLWWKTLEDILKKTWASDDIINSIFNRRYTVANTLDDIADNFDYISHNVKMWVYEIMKQQGFNHNTSWYIAQIVDFIAF